MQRIPIQDNGLIGVLYLPKKISPPHPLVITIGGFRGGLSEARAARLASCGFASLAVAYFGCMGLPTSLREIPLEYCERWIEWIVRHHALIDASRIALWGVSRGAELSLLLGSILLDQIKAIVATVPSSAIYGSIQSDAPAWTYRGFSLGPNAPFPKFDFRQVGKKPESAVALTPYFLEGMKDRDAFTASLIPVERIQCPLLLISGEDDQMWPSSIFSGQIAERLQARRSSIPCAHFSYPGAGHAISSSDSTVQLHPVANMWFAFGGNPRDNALARVDSWEKTLHFLRSWLI